MYLDEIVRDAWKSPTAVELTSIAAIAKARRMQSEGRTLVTRERTAASTLVPPFPSRYVKFAELLVKVAVSRKTCAEILDWIFVLAT